MTAPLIVCLQWPWVSAAMGIEPSGVLGNNAVLRAQSMSAKPPPDTTSFMLARRKGLSVDRSHLSEEVGFLPLCHDHVRAPRAWRRRERSARAE